MTMWNGGAWFPSMKPQSLESGGPSEAKAKCGTPQVYGIAPLLEELRKPAVLLVSDHADSYSTSSFKRPLLKTAFNIMIF